MPSARVVNHSGCSRHPRVVGRALQREVERDLEAELVRLGDERVEVLERAEVGMDGVVAALGRADRPRDAGIAGPGVERVVRALAKRRADRMDRREVDDVEAHGGDGRQPLRRGGEGARLGRVERRAFGAREELVPRAVERALAVDPERVRARDFVSSVRSGWRASSARTSRSSAADNRSTASPGQRNAVATSVSSAAAMRSGVSTTAAPCAAGDLGGRLLVQPGAFFEHQLDVLAFGNLDQRVVPPGFERVAPGFDLEGPRAGRVGRSTSAS